MKHNKSFKQNIAYKFKLTHIISQVIKIKPISVIYERKYRYKMFMNITSWFEIIQIIVLTRSSGGG
jgi:hypothetical protein